MNWNSVAVYIGIVAVACVAAAVPVLLIKRMVSKPKR